MAKLLCICIGLTKFEENPEGSSIFCVDLTWNDPNATVSHDMDWTGQPDLQLHRVNISILFPMFHLHCATCLSQEKVGLISYNNCRITTWDSSPSDSGQDTQVMAIRWHDVQRL